MKLLRKIVFLEEQEILGIWLLIDDHKLIDFQNKKSNILKIRPLK